MAHQRVVEVEVSGEVFEYVTQSTVILVQHRIIPCRLGSALKRVRIRKKGTAEI